MNDASDKKPEEQSEFERMSHDRPTGILTEFRLYLKENKKWWLVPLLVALAIYAIFLIASLVGGPLFIYRFI